MEVKINNQIRECIIDETTSICWETDSMNEGLAFLLQKELIERFFPNNELLKNEEN